MTFNFPWIEEQVSNIRLILKIRRGLHIQDQGSMDVLMTDDINLKVIEHVFHW